MLRAYDKATGKEGGSVYMPAPQSGSPMTYMAACQSDYQPCAVIGGVPMSYFGLIRIPRQTAARTVPTCFGEQRRISARGFVAESDAGPARE